MFSEIQKQKLVNFLDSLQNNTQELEIRLGRFENRFIPGINLEDWELLKDKHKSFKHYQQKTIDSFFTLNNKSWRRTQVLDTENKIVDTFWILKDKKESLDIKEYDFRVSLARESLIRTGNQYEELQAFAKNNKPEMFRNKNRISFEISPVIQLDLSIIETQKQIVYEAELEFKEQISIESFENIVKEFIKIYQNTLYILTNTHKNGVINEYLSLTGSKKNLIGPQAVSLQLSDLKNISRNYSVTDKLDGERCQMFFNQYSEVFLINPKMKIIKIFEVKDPSFNGTIIDGEYYNIFWAFDLLFLRGLDFREKEQQLMIRLGWIQEIQKFVQTQLDPKGKKRPFFQVKNFYTGPNIFLSAQQILDNKSPEYKLDGLIFTPLNKAIPLKKTWNSLYKWKFEELNSIDLKIEKKDIIDGNQNWLLYVYNGKNYQLFSPSIKGYEKLYQTSVPLKESETYTDSSIVEFVLKDKKLKPIRSRTDKTHSNYIDIALSVLDNILHPVKSDNLKFLSAVADDQIDEAIKDIIKTQGKVSTQTVESLVNYKEPFKKMRAFHNQIKKEQIKSISEFYKVKSLLSLGSGKGGDLQKWSSAGIKKVIGFDLNPNFVQEACKRYNNLKENKKIDKNLQVQFEVANLKEETILNASKSSQWTKDYLKTNNLFDAVEAQFCLHYFLESDEYFSNFMLNVISKLKQGGVFYGTILDGYFIHEIPGSQIQQLDDSGQVLFNIEKNYDYAKKYNSVSFFNQQIIVDLKAETIDHSVEYLVKFEDLVNKLDKIYGLVLVETQEFSKIKGFEELDDYEQLYSGFSRTFVFKYRGQFDQKIVSISEALNAIHINTKPDLSIWSYWTWNESKNFPKFVYTKKHNQIKPLLVEASLETMPYIIIQIAKEQKYKIVNSSFTDNLINIKNFIIQGKSQFLIFVSVVDKKGTTNYYLMAKKDPKPNIFMTKIQWAELD